MTNLADKGIDLDGTATRLRINSWQYPAGVTLADYPNKFSKEQVSKSFL